MYIRAANLPGDLIRAHAEGELVLFVGAGASRDAPASLPDFISLARQIVLAVHAEEPDLEAALTQPDLLLGRLEDAGHEVHRLVADRLQPPGSEPNDLHRAIVDLAADPAVRIVTTNYDKHLSTALSDAGEEIREYVAPALPMGDDFDGIVYLHGSLTDEPRHLVVTDRDFGRAYLRHAWAARFLERMYARYSVLFVGYSHSDVVLRYLARSLGDERRRYILTSEPQRSDWRPLGLTPIGYERVGHDHSELPRILARWAELATMGLLDHRQRTRELVAGAPSHIPEEMSYIEQAVADEDRVAFFVEFARGPEWLRWVENQSNFKALFDPSAPPSAASKQLAAWFGEHYATDETMASEAVAAVERAGGHLSAWLWDALGWCLHRLEEPRESWLHPLVTLLVQQAPDNRRDWLEYALAASRWPEDRPTMLLLLERLTEPRITLQKPLLGDGPPHIEVEAPGSEYLLRKVWDEVLEPNLAQAALDLVPIVDRHLRKANTLLLSGRGLGTFDSWSFRRSSVAPHDQDDGDSRVDLLLDIARDSSASLMETAPEVGGGYLAQWAASDARLLQRLAIHGWAHRPDRMADERIEWLLARGWLFETWLKTEVFELLRLSVADLSAEVSAHLVEVAAAGPTTQDEARTHAYERFNILTWIVQYAPHMAEAHQQLKQVCEEYPDFMPRTHPDLNVTTESGWVEPNPPMTPEQFHAKISNGASAALAELEQYRHVPDHAFGATNWSDVLTLLTKSVKAYPEDGFELLDATPTLGDDQIGAVIEGWAGAALKPATAEAVVDRASSFDLVAFVHPLSRMLADGGANNAHPTDWRRVPGARDLARRLWEVQPVDGDEAVGPEADWLGRAINHPAGRLAEFWVRVVALEWSEAGEDWAGLPDELEAQLAHLLVGDDMRSAMAETILASQLRMLFGASPDWATSNLIPLFTRQEDDRAERAWHGFLYWGWPTTGLLNAGLLEAYLGPLKRFETLDDRLQDQLSRHLAAIALSPDLEIEDWLRRVTAVATVDARSSWMESVAWMLPDLPAEAVEDNWQRWLRPYWEERLKGVPAPLTTTEGSALALCVPHLTDSIGEAAHLATLAPAGLRDGFLPTFDTATLALAPRPIAALVTHLLQHVDGAFWDCSSLKELVGHLRLYLGQEDLTPILGEALRLKCLGAADW
jgi:hypothetical protein